MIKKKVLIMGANGLIGNFCFKKLTKHYDVYGLSHKQSNNKRILQTDYVNLSKKIILLINKSSFIINCIGENSNEKKMKKINVDILKTISSVIKKKKNKYFIHLSTCGVYGLSKLHKNIKETSKPKYISLYSQTKLDGENILLENLNTKLTLIILRPSQVIGRNMKNTSLKKLYFYIKKKIFFYVNNKNCFFSYIFINDLLNVINKIIIQQPSSNIYNISNQIKYSKLVEIIQIHLNQNFFYPSFNYNIIKFFVIILGKFFSKFPLNEKNLNSLATYNKFNSNKILKDLKINSLEKISSKNLKYLIDE